MATLTKFTENVNNIQALSDRPNTRGLIKLGQI